MGQHFPFIQQPSPDSQRKSFRFTNSFSGSKAFLTVQIRPDSQKKSWLRKRSLVQKKVPRFKNRHFGFKMLHFRLFCAFWASKHFPRSRFFLVQTLFSFISGRTHQKEYKVGLEDRDSIPTYKGSSAPTPRNGGKRQAPGTPFLSRTSAGTLWKPAFSSHFCGMEENARRRKTCTPPLAGPGGKPLGGWVGGGSLPSFCQTLFLGDSSPTHQRNVGLQKELLNLSE